MPRLLAKDLNDYIAPAQSCIVSLSGGKLDPNDGIQLQKRVKKLLASNDTLAPAAAIEAVLPPTDPVKITLHDCLACSGCITSAETVLLQHQSGDEFLTKLATPGVTVIVSIAPQSRAALSALYGMPAIETFQRLTGWLHSIGVRRVLDVSCGRDMSLLETAADFVERYRSSHECSTSGRNGMRVTGDCASPMDVDTTGSDQSGVGATHGPLPMLASACPGWVCYAEKTQGPAVLPHISSARSPQAMMGGAIKRFLCPALGIDPATCYHCAVMPCYDKKLEAARDELCLPGGSSVPETDACLTTVELHQLLLQAGVSHLRDVPPSPLDSLLPGKSLDEDGRLYGLPGGSGGYADFVMRTAAYELFGRILPPGPLPFKALRNADLQEVALPADDPAQPPRLRFALAYGFRNIQAIMRKIKSGRCEYQYVEVMACPSGCNNGGGQLKPATAGLTPQQLLEQVEERYQQGVLPRHPSDNGVVQELYNVWVRGGVFSPSARDLLHTTYLQREKTVTSTISDW